ncbi:DNA-binding transcriptional regulator, LysR family [Poseidonocella pacifica]|uniref:DNA-binding transcriptional regulator, LysR family n=2 Tax=Poseidonocella pacifica TaxID=871651 RepID=A0A1I0W8Y6_9RHOB|nr:DNA-binding transcriptional regulator, LysR family [Poseidonocella pacifica]
MMDTASLRLFVRAAEKLNIGAAGRDLGLAPAVAGAHLAKLENAIGADLLHRTTRKVSLSLEGAEFLPFAREILAQEDAARAALGKGHATPRGTLRFTAPSTFAQLYIAPILPEFLQRYPELTLDLRLSDSVFDLIEGSFDLAIRNSALQDSSLKGRKLADDTRVLCASPAYLKEHGTPSHPRDLAQHQLIAFKNQTARPLIGPDGQKEAFDPSAAACRLVLDDGLTQKLATIAGAGISMNSLWSVGKELATGDLVQVLPDFEVAEKTVLWLVYPKSNVLSPKVRVFMDFLIEKVMKAASWGRL